MHVIKRDGSTEAVRFDKITARIDKLCGDLCVDATLVAQKTIQDVYAGVRTSDLDKFAAETAMHIAPQHPDYARLAGRIAIDDLHKTTCARYPTFSKFLQACAEDELVNVEAAKDVAAHAKRLDDAIDLDRDMQYDFFGYKTLERSYLIVLKNGTRELPQYMLMRCAVGVYGADVDNVLSAYDDMSRMLYTHATPTLFNACTLAPQLSSCFLLTMSDDSIQGIYKTLGQCAQISKYAGGIGLSISNVRSKGARIKSNNGVSNGIVPMLKVFDQTARYVDQGGGKRKGGFAVYLEPWHVDVREFLELKRNHGKGEVRARDLFYAMWIPDLFMQRVKADEMWSLFCPHDAPDLQDAFGPRFAELYHEYEQKGVARATLKAVDLFGLMLQAQLETGTPYMMFKDACNLKSNHQHLGTIRSSNLCTEIVQYSSPSEVAVCNLASISLPRCVSADRRSFDHDALASIVQRVTRALNRVIERTFYPLEEARHSNLKHRPIGIGVQGLADVFMMLHLPFDSDDARTLNKTIFETIYFAALDASCSLAAIHGTHASYGGSKASEGVLQHDMWGVPDGERLPWVELRKRIATHGLRNSLLVAPMPTASTAQIMNNTECIEPITSNVYARRVLAGEFPVINKHLVSDLGPLWTTTLCQQIIANRGSVQSLKVPQWIKDVHKTAWEIKQRRIIDMAADRGAYIDQSQSLNLFLADSTAAKLAAMHRHVWEMGLKGSYYLRTRPAVDAVKFTIDPKMLQTEQPSSNAACDCDSCGA